MKDLALANKLLEELSKKNTNISPVSVNDFELFQSFFDKEKKHTYGNSWTYVTQGVYGIGPNGLGYKYYDGTNLSMICIYPKIEDPTINAMYWIRPMGEGILDIIIDFAKNIKKDLEIPTYVKKIFPEQFEYLAKHGFKDTKEFPWHTTAPSEDDTYPEQIINCNWVRATLPTLPRRNILKNAYLNKQRLMNKFKFEIKDFNFEKAAWSLTENFFSNVKKNGESLNFSDPDDYYNVIFNNPSRPGLNKKIIYIDGVPMGFCVWENNKSNYTMMHALIVNRDEIKQLADSVILYIVENSNTELLNLGGSEDEGIDTFKLKYNPLKNVMRWAVYA